MFPVKNKTLLTSTKAELSDIASKIVESADDGYTDPLEVMIQAKKGFYVFDSIIKAMAGKASIPEGKTYETHSCLISQRATGVKYYYDGCNDPEWNALSAQLNDVKERMETREAYLKSLKGPVKIEELVCEDTGEILKDAITVFPAAKIGGESLVFNLK